MPQLQPEAFVRMKRAVFRLSERSDSGKIARWMAERDILESLDSNVQDNHLTRNQVMYFDFQFIWPLDFSKHDILHEYFIPIDKAQSFITALKTVVPKRGQNLLNVTIRHVKADPDSLLSYAREESLAFVLLFSQSEGALAEEAMEQCTHELIDEALKLNGTFYLPYRRHYTKEQLVNGYPSLEEFKKVKRESDPKLIFQNRLWESFN